MNKDMIQYYLWVSESLFIFLSDLIACSLCIVIKDSRPGALEKLHLITPDAIPVSTVVENVTM